MTDEFVVARPTVAIVISGPSRTGKTTASNLLAARYGIPNVKIGEIFRRRTGIDTSKYVERDPKIDREMDELQLEMIRTASSEAPFILEGRLAAVLASEAREARAERRPLPIVTILFWAPEEVRMERQLRKVLRDDPTSGATLPELLEGEREREARDMVLWRLVHPELDKKQIFDPSLVDATGKPVYDLVVDTRMGRPDEVATHVHDWLVQRGAIVPVSATSDDAGAESALTR